MTVNETFPAGEAARRRRMRLLIASRTTSLPDFVVSNKSDPSEGYCNTSGAENAARPGNARRASRGRTSQSRFTSTFRLPNFAVLANVTGGDHSRHVGELQSLNSCA